MESLFISLLRLTQRGIAGLLIIYSSSVHAAPNFTVSGVSANAEQMKIVVSGSGFGSGPKIVLRDTYDAVPSVIGDPISTIGPEVGEWTEINRYYPPTYSETARSGNRSVKIFDGMTQKFNQMILKYDGTTEFFVSYWVYLEGPDYFPGDKVAGPRTFSEDSSYKMLWVFDSDVLGNSSDVALPTHVGGGRFYLAGNDANLVTNVGNEWWSWDHWMRVSFWLKANPDDPTVPGIIHFDTLSQDRGLTKRAYDVPVFDADGPELKQYQQMNFPGWVRSIQSSDTNILYDDIYVSTGPNSAARVEIGNAAYLNEVTRLDLLTINSWSDTDINATASTVTKEELGEMYLYITDFNGNTNQQGIALVSPPAAVPFLEVE